MLATISLCSTTKAQIFAPGRGWEGITQYDVDTVPSDPIFVFFVDTQRSLRAQFSDSSASEYKWFKYNPNMPYVDRFQVIDNAFDSTLLDIERGGYQVQVTRLSDDSIQVYRAWVMIDDVSLAGLTVESNRCEILILELLTLPDNFYEINYSDYYFKYYDITTNNHRTKSVLGNQGYFGDYTFRADPADVPVDELPPFLENSHKIDISFENSVNDTYHGPLVDAKYKLTVHTPFGRGNLEVETDVIPAISTKIDLSVFFKIDGQWEEQNQDSPNGEALLEVKLESKAENSDFVVWELDKVLKVSPLYTKTIWADSMSFGNSNEVYLPKALLVPGYYKVEHTAKNTSSGCVDRVSFPFDEFQFIEVDSSLFNENAIPNVFTPNGMNPVFVFVSPPTNIRSIEFFRIRIFSRWGKQVYHYIGDPKEWEGWNGKIDGTKGDAAPGVYYFIIEARGWDGQRFREGSYKGFLHLFR